VLILGFLWWRPQGIFPERRRKLGAGAARRKAGQEVVPSFMRPMAARGSQSPPMLKIKNLGRDFGGVRAVETITFDVAPGCVTG